MKEIIKFYSSHCGPCKALSSQLSELNVEGITEVDVESEDDKVEELIDKYSIGSLPVLVFVKDGEEVERMKGIHPLSELKEAIENFKKI